MSEKWDLQGVIAAVLTPFDQNGRLHIERLQDHIRWLETQGCAAVLLAGTTGEGPSLSLVERKSLLEAGIRAAAKARVLACTTCASLPETIELTRHAFDQGAYAVTVMPPFFFKGVSDDGLYAYFSQILEQAVPVNGRLLLYHIPQVTGVPVRFELISRLIDSGYERLVGIKDSAGDLEHCRQLCLRFPSLRVFTGNDQFLLEALHAGARGCVTGVVNVFARMAADIFQAHQAGDPAALDLQNKFSTLWSVLDRYQPYPVLMKALLAKQEGEPGWKRARPPLVPMPQPAFEQLLDELSALDLPPQYSWLQEGRV